VRRAAVLALAAALPLAAASCARREPGAAVAVAGTQADAAPAAGRATAPADAAGAGHVDVGLGGPGGSGVLGLGSLDDDPAPCSPPPGVRTTGCPGSAAAPRVVVDEVTRLVRQTASRHTRMVQEVDVRYQVPVYFVKDVRVWERERTPSLLDLLVSYESRLNPQRSMGSPWFDRRGSERPVEPPAPAPVRECGALGYRATPAGWMLEAPACLPGVGRVSFKPRPVRLGR
jgi:hypothetical protein